MITDADRLAMRRIAAVVVDVMAQLMLSIGMPRLLGNLYLLAGCVMVLPVLYSAGSIILSASPAQRLFGLRVVTLGGAIPHLGVRIRRALIIKAIYLQLLINMLTSGFVPAGLPSDFLICCNLLVAIAALISLVFAEQMIEMDEPTFYDRWLRTRVVRSKNQAGRGFEVIAISSETRKGDGDLFSAA